MNTPTLTVDLTAIVKNYRLLQARHVKGACAAVVKADAYGLGMEKVARALWKAACDTFFVATLEEGAALRKVLPGVAIYVFEGVLKGEVQDFLAYNLRPVLNSLEQVARWREAGGAKPEAAVHVDTGMCRLGLSLEELPRIDTAALLRDDNVTLLMSHLACASEPEHPLNAEQRRRFEQARNYFPGIACSLINSSGHFLDSAFHYDLGRPGCALYGITPNPSLPNPMHAVAEWKAPILQIRTVEREQTVGYGATATVAAGRKVATVACGYADGMQRIGSNLWPGYIGDCRCPMLGRISMDMAMFDVTGVPAGLLAQEGAITLLGERQGVDEVAAICQTIGYEIFTGVGGRVKRLYRQ